jgi:hypothetical protein
MAATQQEDDFDYERDSVSSNSSWSTRIRLQEKIGVIDQKPAYSTTPANIKDWIRKHAANVMAQSCNHEDVDPSDAAYCGFKRVQNIFKLLFNAIRRLFQSECDRSTDQCCKDPGVSNASFSNTTTTWTTSFTWTSTSRFALVINMMAVSPS